MEMLDMKVAYGEREEAALELARRLSATPLKDPVVLAVPPEGLSIGVVIAAALHAPLDVMIARRLRAPYDPAESLGAVGEGGDLFIAPGATQHDAVTPEYIDEERELQTDEVQRLCRLYRSAHRRASLEARTVILVDHCAATPGALQAAAEIVRLHRPREVIIASPVASSEALNVLRRLHLRIECLAETQASNLKGCSPRAEVDDGDAIALLRNFDHVTHAQL